MLHYDPAWNERHLKILAGREDPPRVVPLRYNSVQHQLNRIVHEETMRRRPVRLICLKARQEGVSTWTESIIYARCRRFPQQTALILSHDPTGTSNLYSMFRRFKEHDMGAPETVSMHQAGLTFASPHSSMVTIQTAAKRFAGTGQTIQLAHLSEVAKWPFPDETMLSLMQAMPAVPSSFAVIESTAYGAGGWFHEQWEMAQEGTSQWRPVFFSWLEHLEYQRDPEELYRAGDIGREPRYNYYEGEERDLQSEYHATDAQLAWRRWCIDTNCGGDVLLFHQEYPTVAVEAFVVGGEPRFSVPILRQWYHDAQDPEFVGEVSLDISRREPDTELRPTGDGWLRLWEKPQAGASYVIGADCAGTDPGGDANAAAILRLRPRKLVGTIHGLRGADYYARALANVGTLYNEALIAVEVNGVGEACQSHLRHWYRERNMYHRVPIDRHKRRPGERIGWYTGHVQRHNLIEDLDSAIRDETLEVRDEETLLELLNFQRVPGPRNGEAKPGTHDDRVLALGIALQAAAYTVSGEYDHFEEGRHVRSSAPVATEIA